MEVRILVFLFFTCATVVTNTCLILFACKAFSGLTSKVDATVSAFEKNSEMREWLDSMQTASAQAIVVTQATKDRMAELEPALARAEESFNRSLAQVDSKLEEVADQITTNAERVQETVVKPAISAAAFAAGLTKAFEAMQSRDE
ncbi:MAG TPA: hypothetical protein VGK48_09725 [Terriglobia bacterium]|jgi:biopolymer transport protein ExbB/TolQ